MIGSLFKNKVQPNVEIKAEVKTEAKTEVNIDEYERFKSLVNDRSFFDKCKKLWDGIVTKDETANDSNHEEAEAIKIGLGQSKQFEYIKEAEALQMARRLSHFLLLHDRKKKSIIITDVAFELSKIQEKKEIKEMKELKKVVKNFYKQYKSFGPNTRKVLAYALIKTGYSKKQKSVDTLTAFNNRL